MKDMDTGKQREIRLEDLIPSKFPTCPICNKVQQGTWERCDICDACPVHHENNALGHKFEED